MIIRRAIDASTPPWPEFARRGQVGVDEGRILDVTLARADRWIGYREWADQGPRTCVMLVACRRRCRTALDQTHETRKQRKISCFRVFVADPCRYRFTRYTPLAARRP